MAGSRPATERVSASLGQSLPPALETPGSKRPLLSHPPASGHELAPGELTRGLAGLALRVVLHGLISPKTYEGGTTSIINSLRMSMVLRPVLSL